jgi:hypothetical protein
MPSDTPTTDIERVMDYIAGTTGGANRRMLSQSEAMEAARRVKAALAEAEAVRSFAERVRELENRWEADARRREAIKPTRSHEAANLLAIGIIRTHAAALRALRPAETPDASDSGKEADVPDVRPEDHLPGCPMGHPRRDCDWAIERYGPASREPRP